MAKIDSKKTNKKSSSKKHASTAKIAHIVRFPVVAVGASAGGLEAYERFFSNVPVKTGMAYVIITHLDPDHTSVLADLLKKYTPVPISTIIDGVKILPDNIYVMPPGKNVVIKEGRLRLVEEQEPHYSNLPINFFFHSLALEKAKYAAAIVLSGAGMDGSIGARDVKLHGGLVIAQDPLTAKFDSMPASVINTGCADYVLSPDQIPQQLIKWANDEDISGIRGSSELQLIFSIIRAKTGYDFSAYKLSTICRRIEKQMLIHNCASLPKYIAFLNENPKAVDQLFKDFLIGVTRFFRDPEVFEIFQMSIIPKLLGDKPQDYNIRVWVPGCATGEEAYSLAIIIAEYMEVTKKSFFVHIFGTDIDSNALLIARAGIYSESIEKDVTPERLKRFFTKEKNNYKVKKEIRSMVIFGEQNIIKDPPFTKIDIISCRNLLIYLNVKLQKKIIPLFHYSLRANGVLFLGSSESISGFTELFEVAEKKAKIFKNKNVARSWRLVSIPDVSQPHNLAFQHIKEKFLTNEKFKINQNVSNLLLEKYKDKNPVSDVAENVVGKKNSKAVKQLERELISTRENLQATIEELESSNEELQSLNEELQSTNEEIETSKEELHSLNEELIHTNTELQSRIDQLATVHDDMANLFNSTEIATFFLDNELRIKRYTPKAKDFIHLIPSDVGRPISHFATTIRYEKLMEDAQEVLRTLQPKVIEVQGKLDRWFLIRILPYRTVANVIDGVVITLTDITDHKEAERKLNQLNDALKSALLCSKNIIDTMTMPILVLTTDLKVISANRSFYKIFQLLPEDVIAKYVYEISGWHVPQLRELLKREFPNDNLFEGYEIEVDLNRANPKKLLVNARKIFNSGDDNENIILLVMDPK